MKDFCIPLNPCLQIDYRLPRRVLPKSYDLFLDLVTDTVFGKVKIPVKVVKATETITINSSGLFLLGITLENENEEKSIAIRGYEENLITEMVIITLSEVLTISSTYVLSIDFKHLTNRIVKYGSARTKFPCFDEPDIKVPLKLTLTIPLDQIPLSTVDSIAKTEVEEDRRTISFNESPLMSAQANFDCTRKVPSTVIVKPSKGREITFSIYTVSDSESSVSYALQCGSKVFEYISEDLQMSFPLLKLDFIAELDLAFQAIGTFGLTTIKADLLINTNKNSSTANRLRTESCVCNEILKVWFGGLVTAKWWNDLWLEEGITKYLKDKILNSIYAHWNVVHDSSFVLEFDSTLMSCPIKHNIGSPWEISLIFESISCFKGAALLRMMEYMIGFDKIKEIITQILHRFAYNSFKMEDLLDEIDLLKLDQNLKTVVRSWTEQVGYPVIDFEKTGDFNYTITQKRFLRNPSDYNKVVDHSEFG